jgi:hypothetical protein
MTRTMKMIGSLLLAAPILLFSCNIENADWEGDEVTGIGVSEDGTVLRPVEVDPSPPDSIITHSNDRFRNVHVRTVGEQRFQIVGEAQVFEANISWTIEDGHHVLKEGHVTTSAGAPEWGAFDFTVTAQKARENSTLHLVLYESSAKDGSRQHELPLLLY